MNVLFIFVYLKQQQFAHNTMKLWTYRLRKNSKCKFCKIWSFSSLTENINCPECGRFLKSTDYISVKVTILCA